MSEERSSRTRFFGSHGPAAVTKGVRITSAVFWNLLLIFFILGLAGAAFAGGAGAGYFASLVQDEPVRDVDELSVDIFNYEETTEVYFAGDEYLGDLPSPLERREVDLENISDHLVNAVIATEDEYFFEHDGIVPKALMRAVYQDFSNAATQTGGSTLTQQLVKNQVLSSEVTHDRKAAEILLAMRVEQFMEKDEILEAYLNIVPFGRNANGRQVAGAEAAAQGIFGVSSSELNIPQAAFIAGMPQSPFSYTPFLGSGEVKEDMEAGLNRMSTVLNRMHRHGYITDEEYEEALDYDIRDSLTGPTPSSYEEYPFIVDTVRDRAEQVIFEHLLEEDDVVLEDIEDEEYRQLQSSNYREAAREALQRNGYVIHTTIDKDIYDAQQEAVAEYENFGPDRTDIVENEEGEEVEVTYQEEVGSVLIDNRTGAIISFVGGRDFQQSQFNHATGNALRHTGSTMKSLLTYALGFETGDLQPGFITPDTPYEYESEEDREVTNFDDDHSGMITAREALSRSRNVPAVREFHRVDQDFAREAMINYGLERFMYDENLPYEGTPLGTMGMTVEANTSAYSVFGNEGNRKEAHMIASIEDSEGNVIFEQDTEEEVEVVSPQTAYLMIDVMRDVMESGLGTAPNLPGYLDFESDLSGKTGTSQALRDSWFVGLNPHITQGLWIGYDDDQFRVVQEHNGMGYGPRTQMLWADLANAAYEVDPDLMAPEEDFERPDGIVEETICGITGMLPSDLCEEAGFVTTDLFNEEFVPDETDDSLERVDYVRVNGDTYLALDSTPSEFTRQGVSVRDDFFDLGDEDLSEYLPDDWDNLISTDEEAPDNGRTPGAPSISTSGDTVTWNEHEEGDVVGYRIYRASNEDGDFSEVTSVRWDEDFEYSGSGGAYYVTAVDVAGRESSASSTVTIGTTSGGDNDEDDNSDSDNADNDTDNESDSTNNNSSNNDNDDNNESDDSNNNDNSSDNDNSNTDNTNDSNNENNSNTNSDNDSSDNNGNGNSNDSNENSNSGNGNNGGGNNDSNNEASNNEASPPSNSNNGNSSGNNEGNNNSSGSNNADEGSSNNGNINDSESNTNENNSSGGNNESSNEAGSNNGGNNAEDNSGGNNSGEPDNAESETNTANNNTANNDGAGNNSGDNNE
ncbi:transglycosylase domain-containing protein [Alkalicoccus luteus]|uniref:transglycosylase domain-containing protein n=1 Tax=Alkalicoccus luteus TaxID=1237094 RepID=UPI0031B64997